MNFSGSGTSWTVGPRGASVNIGKRGTYLSGGIPGTGFSSRQRLSGETNASRLKAKQTVTVSVSVFVDDDTGAISVKDANGKTLSDEVLTQVKKQQGEALRGLIGVACEKVNAPIEALSKIHVDTTDPQAPRYQPAKFDEPAPSQPAPKRIGFFDKLFGRRARIEAANQAALERYQADKANWEALKAQFVTAERDRKTFIEKQVLVDPDAMDKHLENTLQDIVWPRETLVSFEIRDDGKTVMLDVDLPELEDMPNRTAVVPAREWRLSVKPMSATQIQKLYMAHVHGVGFRIIGETFAALPTVQKVVLSAFSQRPNKSTGVIDDEYLYSVQVSREQWLRINFANLSSIDVVEALTGFELRRMMTKTGVFKPIEPFGV